MSQIAGAMPFEFQGGRAVTEWKMIGQQAYVVAIERVAQAYIELGVFP